MRRLAFATLLATLIAAALAPAKAGDRRLPLPEGWQPEGIASGPGKSLYVGSIPTGAILRQNARTGATRVVVEPQKGRAAIGVEVAGKRLVAAGGETGKVFFYDRRSGADKGAVTLARGNTFINDIARLRGDFYLTDSRNAVIHRVTRKGGAEAISVPDVPADDDFNLNGIEAVRGHLVAVHSTDGDLYRIDPDDGDALRIDLGGASLTNGDGLLAKGRKLYVVRNRSNEIAVVKLSRDLTSGRLVKTITSRAFDVPTTIAARASGCTRSTRASATSRPRPPSTGSRSSGADA